MARLTLCSIIAIPYKRNWSVTKWILKLVKMSVYIRYCVKIVVLYCFGEMDRGLITKLKEHHMDYDNILNIDVLVNIAFSKIIKLIGRMLQFHTEKRALVIGD